MNGERGNRALVTVGSILFGIIVSTFIFMSSYNGLVDAKEDVTYAQSEVQNKMLRRLELIPELVKVTQAAADHEKEIYAMIVEARKNLTVSIEDGSAANQIADANNQVTVALDKYINAVVENYPEITATEQYRALFDEIAGSVNRIDYAREEYNAAVSKYNRKIKRFPTSLFAALFGFNEADPIKVEE